MSLLSYVVFINYSNLFEINAKFNRKTKIMVQISYNLKIFSEERLSYVLSINKTTRFTLKRLSLFYFISYFIKLYPAFDYIKITNTLLLIKHYEIIKYSH